MAVIAFVVGLYAAPSDKAPFKPDEPELAAPRHLDRMLQADLGGMRVSIPAYFATYVEYDGDPGWGEKRTGKTPQRTPASRLRSFGFDVRYPDMAGLSSPELFEEKRRYRSAETPWILVGFNTGESYSSDGFLDRIADGWLSRGAIGNLPSRYERMSAKEHGLEVYVQVGVDPESKKPYREHRFAEDIFIYRDDAGRVEAEIKCSNRPVAAPPCKHYFNLDPKAKAWVYVSYRRSLLSEWRGIQDSVRRLVFSFETDPSAR
ncbi:hypothetical protein [Variovorax sp. HJSM1_2]|uniref:hypothetical protein n=1 Tax=Variovorax sp. HJSM1_2 TaxID=3366263 RepID=UPI003BDE11EB